MKEAVPHDEAVGICLFTCAECGNTFVVRCRMVDTAPCYECGEEDVEPISFHRLRRIKRTSDNEHNCSRCDGNGQCPNMTSH